ncbi:MAG: dTMP kinase [Deltaproteobacteria bacterium]|nr:dTMP kinase [Deltaproteobacteria bacterium]MBW2068922.1 dTMP kinase [Deltaproteobacteria bacterium]
MTGKVISFEGIDGAGKTSAIKECKRRLRNMGLRITVVEEPGGCELGRWLKTILTENGKTVNDPWAEALLFLAARVENIRELIEPERAKGKWVLIDRFVDSTIAYQGYGRGLDTDTLEEIYNRVSGRFYPDCTILLDCPVDVAETRIAQRATKKSRWERLGRDFFERVRRGYLELAQNNQNRIVVVDASYDFPEVINSVMKILESLVEW